MATLEDAAGNPLAGAGQGAGVVVQLAGYGSQFPRVAGTAIIASTLSQVYLASAAGVLSFRVWGNDQIAPSGTYYTVQVLDTQGNVIQTNAYQFTGAGPVDLSAVAPVNPDSGLAFASGSPSGTGSGSPSSSGWGTAGGGIYAVPSSAAPIFDGSMGTLQQLTLSADVASSTAVKFVPGVPYIFEITQAASGSGPFTFTWPPGIRGAVTVSPTPGSRTLLMAVALADGTMLAFPASYF